MESLLFQASQGSCQTIFWFCFFQVDCAIAKNNHRCPLCFAGLLAKKAVDAGLTVKPYIKTSLSPGSGVVTYYLRESGVMPYLAQLG